MSVGSGAPIAAVATAAVTYAGLVLWPSRGTIIAWAGAAAAIVVGSSFGTLRLEDAVDAIDFNTLSIWLGMMVFAVLLRETGFFQSLAVRAAKRAGGRPVRLMLLLGGATSFVSLVLDNTTTVLIMVPVTMSLIDLLDLPVAPFLIGGVLSASIGGTATLIGDAPNMLIGSAGGLGFFEFITHVAPIAVTAWAVAQGILWGTFRGALRRRIEVERLSSLDERRAIVAPRRLTHLLLTLTATIALLFAHEAIGLPAGTVALAGAAAALLWVHSDFDAIIARIRWDALLRLAALFVVVGGVRATGALSGIVDGLGGLVAERPELAIVAVLWGSAAAAAIVGDVPCAVAALPILSGAGAGGAMTAALWWALVVGVGFGATLSPFGSAANRTAGAMAASVEVPWTFRRWGLPGAAVGLASCALGTGAILLASRIGLL